MKTTYIKIQGNFEPVPGEYHTDYGIARYNEDGTWDAKGWKREGGFDWIPAVEPSYYLIEQPLPAIEGQDLRKQFKKEHPETIGEKEKAFDDANYIEWLEAKLIWKSLGDFPMSTDSPKEPEQGELTAKEKAWGTMDDEPTPSDLPGAPNPEPTIREDSPLAKQGEMKTAEDYIKEQISELEIIETPIAKILLGKFEEDLKKIIKPI